MRPKNSTLTARRVHRCAAAIVQDHLKLPDHGPKCRAGPLLTLLFYAAARITSLSEACRCLRDAPSDEAARLALIATLPDFAELLRRLNPALAGDCKRITDYTPLDSASCPPLCRVDHLTARSSAVSSSRQPLHPSGVVG